jgi:hypothetical protein
MLAAEIGVSCVKVHTVYGFEQLISCVIQSNAVAYTIILILNGNVFTLEVGECDDLVCVYPGDRWGEHTI